MRRGKTVLWRYAREAPDAGLAPLVICYALVNRPYMLDLQPDRSLIRALAARGLDVYLVDWGYPDRGDSHLSLDDYVNRHLGACIDHVRAAHGVAAVNLLGVCQGGTLALCHAALHPGRVRNLITMVTPVDFHTEDNLLSAWVRKVDVDRMVEVLGNVPGTLLNAAFIALMPLRLTARKYAGLADIAADRGGARELPAHGALDPRQPRPGGHRVPRVRPRPVPGEPAAEGRPADRRRRGRPAAGSPAPSSTSTRCRTTSCRPLPRAPLEGLTATRDYSAFEFDGGHIGIYVSRSAQELLPRDHRPMAAEPLMHAGQGLRLAWKAR